uniref:Uncharacterized protein n=1 Tax=Parascaris equorum TaxID=6256 RepID=A0A914S3W7_PAREQ
MSLPQPHALIWLTSPRPSGNCLGQCCPVHARTPGPTTVPGAQEIFGKCMNNSALKGLTRGGRKMSALDPEGLGWV